LRFSTVVIGAVQTYCQAQANSAGCVPVIGWTGTASLGDAQPFAITATQLLTDKPAVLFYSTSGANDVPFLGGTLCARSPVRRTPLSMTSSSTQPCGGTLAFDFETWIASGADATLGASQTVWAQFWSRDPVAASTTNLTDAIAFDVRP